MSEPLVLPAHTSYSQITAMLHCGEQYRLQRGLHLPEAPAWALVGGTAVHESSEQVDYDDPRTPEAIFNECFDIAIAKELEHAPDEYKDTATWRASGRASKAHPNKEDEAYWRTNGPLFLNNWIRWRANSPLEIWRDDDGNLAVELEATVELAGLPVKVFLDRLMTGPSGLSVLDLKSGANMPKSGMQLAVYAHAIKSVYGLDVPYGFFWNARTGATSDAYNVGSEWPKERLDFIFGSVRKWQEDGAFIPNVTAMCSACSVRRYCRAFGGDLSAGVPQPWEVTS